MQADLVDQSTGFLVQLLGPTYSQDSQSIDQEDLVSGSSTFTQVLLNGTYELLYTRGWDSENGLVVFATPTSQPLPYGYHVLASCQRVGP
jgi:hypothetical protein